MDIIYLCADNLHHVLENLYATACILPHILLTYACILILVNYL